MYYSYPTGRRKDDYYGSGYKRYNDHGDHTADDVEFTCQTEQAQNGRISYIRSRGQLHVSYQSANGHDWPTPLGFEISEPGALYIGLGRRIAFAYGGQYVRCNRVNVQKRAEALRHLGNLVLIVMRGALKACAPRDGEHLRMHHR